MKLITEVTMPDYPFRIDQQSPILMMGSCFTENIGSMLEKYLFPVCINPFGVTYNPLSVKTGLDALLSKEEYGETDLDVINDRWLSFNHSTKFSSSHKEVALRNMNESFIRAKTILRNAQILIITWGTAWIYTHNTTGKVVCNCHKIPASQFTRSRLSAKEILEAYHSFLPSLFDFNKNLKILFTVSPVRHWKDGAHGNQLSKATLLLAQEELEKQFPDKVSYFPSYEIVMDELRDYRFYAQDMLHTSNQATQYLWERFNFSLLSLDTQTIIQELNPILKMTGHRPFSDGEEPHRNMDGRLQKKLNVLKDKYPYLTWKNLPEK